MQYIYSCTCNLWFIMTETAKLLSGEQQNLVIKDVLINLRVHWPSSLRDQAARWWQPQSINTQTKQRAVLLSFADLRAFTKSTKTSIWVPFEVHQKTVTNFKLCFIPSFLFTLVFYSVLNFSCINHKTNVWKSVSPEVIIKCTKKSHFPSIWNFGYKLRYFKNVSSVEYFWWHIV